MFSDITIIMKITSIIIIIIFILIIIYLSYKLHKSKNKNINIIDIEDIKYYNENILSDDRVGDNNNVNTIVDTSIDLDHYILNKLLEEHKNIEDYKIITTINDIISIKQEEEYDIKLEDINAIILAIEEEPIQNNRRIVNNNNNNNILLPFANDDINRDLRDNVHDSMIQNQTVENYKEYLEHNELGLALDELEGLGEFNKVTKDYWLNLLNAAKQMGLKEKVEKYQKIINS